ncbi:MAG: hypothetical protein H7Y86_05840 [Rhizobacter sp.]|nr:hypothetical protein [Ferruginibacter sp.]
MNNNFFDESVREKLDGHEAPVPADAWANIQKGKRMRKPWPFFWLLAALVLCSGGIYLYSIGAGGKKIIAPTTLLQPGKTAPANTGQANSSNSSDIILSSSKENNKINNSILLNTEKVNANNNSSAAADLAGVNKNLASRTNNNALVKTNAVLSKKPGSRLKQNSKQGSKVADRFTKIAVNGTGDIENGIDDEINAKKIKLSNTGKVAMQVTNPGTTNNLSPLALSTTGAIYTSDSILTDGKKEEDKVLAEEKKSDTINNVMVAVNTGAKVPDKKKRKTGLDMDLSLSGFMPSGNKATISMIRRTTVEPLHKATFTANKVRVRLQPSIAINFLLFKSLSAKTAVGSGLSYQVIKEYIHLNGEEVNTHYTIVKRLNGNSLVDDTVATVTKGVRNIDAVNSYTLLSIPVSFRYRLLQRSQWTMDLQAGIDINLHSKYKNSIGGELIPQFANANHAKQNKTTGIGFNAGIRWSRRVGKNYLLYAAPYLQLNPTTLYLKEMLAPGKINRAGISFGISYSL